METSTFCIQMCKLVTLWSNSVMAHFQISIAWKGNTEVGKKNMFLLPAADFIISNLIKNEKKRCQVPNNNKQLPIRLISRKSTNSEKAFRFMIWTFHSCHNKPVPPASPHEASFTAVIRSKRSATAQSFRVALIIEKDRMTRTCLFGWDGGDLIENASRGDKILH